MDFQSCSCVTIEILVSYSSNFSCTDSRPSGPSASASAMSTSEGTVALSATPLGRTQRNGASYGHGVPGGGNRPNLLAPVAPRDDTLGMAEPGVPGHEFTVVDVETTGLYWRKDRVVSVAVARCDGAGQPLDQWYTLVNPGCPMGASEIHGLTDATVVDAPRFEDIADELLALLAGAVLVGHNVTFDWRFLSNEYARHGETLPAHDAICTMRLAGSLGLGNPSLDDIAAYCDVALPRAQFHDAREDVLATAGVLARLYPLALAQGIDPVMHLEVATPPILRKTSKCAFVNPGRLAPGGPLVQGMHVVITGETATPREALFARSLKAGLDVMSGVNAKSSLLVTNDIAVGTVKAKDAVALGVPVVDEAAYLRLLDAVAPGTPREQLHEWTRARTAARTKRASARAPEDVLTGPLAGRRVVLLGDVADREHLAELIEHSGGVVSQYVTKNTSLVVLGSTYDAQRLESAEGYDAEVVTPPKLLALLHAGEVLAKVEPSSPVAVALVEPVPAHATQAPSPVESAAAVPGLPAADWLADPTGRFQYRYWDGAAWSAHVSTAGQSYIDPLP